MLQLLEVSQGLGCDAVGEVGGNLCLLESCRGSGTVVMRVPELERDSAVARAVFPTRTPCLKLPKPSCHHLGWSSGLGPHPPGLGAQLSEPNSGCFAESGQIEASPSLCSGEDALMGIGREVGAGPAREGFPHSTVVLKLGAEDTVAVAKPTRLMGKCCFAQRSFLGKYPVCML